MTASAPPAASRAVPTASEFELPRSAIPASTPEVQAPPSVSRKPQVQEPVAPPQAAALAPVVLPTEELTSVVASAGLEWVQTTHAAIDSPSAEVAPAASRPRRQRKPKQPVVAEPLQQVETQDGVEDNL
ncbi:MAG: hypothetical protein H0T52_03430 [Lautropia sp.]|nr:hypothetical protein [Lautropia sp.]